MSVSPLPKPGDKGPNDDYFAEEGRKNLRFIFWLVVVLVILGFLGFGVPDIHIARY